MVMGAKEVREGSGVDRAAAVSRFDTMTEWKLLAANLLSTGERLRPRRECCPGARSRVRGSVR
jgi:hypothetical protein